MDGLFVRCSRMDGLCIRCARIDGFVMLNGNNSINNTLYGCKNWRLAKANAHRIEPDAPEPDAPEPDALDENS